MAEKKTKIMRVVGVIIKDGKILLIRRVKNGEEYYVFPGGSVEKGEDIKDALGREMMEELSLDIKNPEFLFEIDNRGQKESYFLIVEFTGVTELGGPEKKRMSAQNQYYLEWTELLKTTALKNLFPREAFNKLRSLPETHPSLEYYKAFPKKRMAAGVMIMNDAGELLLVKNSYKSRWSIPGGIVDANESPRQAAIRETKEEVGIDLKICQLLSLDYNLGDHEEDESLQFIFYGGVLTNSQVSEIKPDGNEIEDYKFVKLENALVLLSEGLRNRLPKCLEALKNNAVIYLESGVKVEI